MTFENNTEASIAKTAFSCPHCGAYTTQTWYKLVASSIREDNRIPFFPTDEFMDKMLKTTDITPEDKQYFLKLLEMIRSGKPRLEEHTETFYSIPSIINGHVSKCYNCQELTIWIHDSIVYPRQKISIQPNKDLPEYILRIFEEAREVVEVSPKGAAALLRLCVQYLCKELGEPGKNLDVDIGTLVRKGLNSLVQQALDVVRVIGNESVHPGEIDLNDNRDIAIKLFELVNLICDQMISHPKNVKTLYENLPPSKLDGIEQRNTRVKK